MTMKKTMMMKRSKKAIARRKSAADRDTIDVKTIKSVNWNGHQCVVPNAYVMESF